MRIKLYLIFIFLLFVGKLSAQTIHFKDCNQTTGVDLIYNSSTGKYVGSGYEGTELITYELYYAVDRWKLDGIYLGNGYTMYENVTTSSTPPNSNVGSTNANGWKDTNGCTNDGQLAKELVLTYSGGSSTTAPTVTTATATAITATSATLGGNVTADGGATVTERGIVWATTTNPTTANNKVIIGDGTGTFSQTVGSLPSATLIYYRAYAINSVNTSYGNSESFTTPASPTITTSVTTLTPFSTCSGTASAAQTFTVLGSNLTANLVITPPTGYEVSYDNNHYYNSSFTIVTVGTITLYARLRANAAGNPAGNIAVTSNGATTKNIAVSSTIKTVPATPTASSNSPVNSGVTLNLSTSTVSGAIYAWTGPNGFSSSLQNPSITNVTAAAAGTYSVTVKVDGCTSAAGTTTVTVNSLPNPTLDQNQGITINANESKTVESGQLHAADTQVHDDAQKTFTITTATTKGTLFLDNNGNRVFDNGDTELVLGNTFTQDDINNDKLIYLSTNNSATSDSFGFELSMPDGRKLSNQTFNITIIPATVVTAVTVPANATYGVGQALNFTIKFSGNVTVTGTPRLALTIGSTTRYAIYTSGSGIDELAFTYTVQAGDLDVDGITVANLELNSGTIKDGAGNGAVLTLNGVASTSGVLVDGVAPTVANVTSSATNKAYKIGDIIAIEVNFSENVTVTGTPQLTLETGTVDRVINYSTGTGTSSLIFNYTVQAGDTSADLDYLSTTALALNGGTISDAVGNSAVLTLPTPGATGSLGANKNIVIDGVAPSASSITLAGTSPTNLAQVVFNVTFSEPVTGVDVADFTLTTSVGITGATISSVSGSGNTYTVTVSTGTGDGTIGLDLNNSGTGIKDGAGNDITGGFTGVNVYTIDKTPPTTTIASLSFSDDTGISNTDFITKTSAQTISGTLSANLQTGEKVYISLDNGATYQLATATVGSSTFSLAGVTLIGSNTIKVYVGDEAGNHGTGYEHTYTLDTSAPAAPSTPELAAASDSGISNSDHITNVTQPTFTGTAEVGSTVTLYNGSTVLGTGTATDGTWSITLTSPLAQGAYSITAKATDIAGNESSASSAIDITIDTSSPSVTISSNLSALKAGQTATITFTFSEDPGNSFTLGDVTISAGVLSGFSGTGLTRTAFFTPNAGVDNGTAAIKVTAGSYTDIAGNLGLLGTLSPNLTYDTKAPAAPTGLAATAANIQNELSWTANTETDLASYNIYWGTSANPTTLLTTLTASTSTYIHTGVTNGTTYYYRITAIDQAGNESAYSTEVMAVPKAPQTITFNAIAVKTYGDADFDAGATASSGLVITYSSDNSSVATIVAGKVHIVGAGTANITASQAGNTTYASAVDKVQTLTVNKKALTVTATGNNKEYDGNAAAVVSLSDDRVTGDVLTLTYSSASFDDKNKGNNKPINISGINVTGTSAGNYTFNSTASATANITVKALTVTATGNNKEYDGNATATVTLSDDRINGDVLSLTYSTATFNDKNVGTNKPVSVTGISIGSTDANNYTFNSTASATANITAKALTVTATANDKIYDGNAVAVVSLSDDRINGDVLTLSHSTATFNDKNVGTNKPVSVTGISIGSTDANNYTFNSTASATANITVKTLTVTATGNNKEYDGNATATVNLSDDRVTGDVLTLTYSTATFNDKNVGTSKPVSVTGISIGSTDANNYTFNSTASATANITAKALTVTATANDKVYDGNATATVSLSDDRINGDVLSLTYSTATFNDKNVGTSKPVSVTGISIGSTDANNYTFNSTASATASITIAKLSYVATATGKVYGDANPALSGTVTGFVGTDTQATATTGTLNFSTTASNASSIGSYAINGSGLTAQNYAFEQAAGNAAALTITARPVTIKADAKAKTYGDNDPVLTYQIATGNLVNGDTFTGTLVRDAGQNADSYAIKQGTVALSNNYNLSYQSANLVINKALLTITVNNGSRCYGTNNPSFSVSYNGFKYTDNENSLTTKPTVSTTANTSSVAGNYDLVASGGVSGNYNFSYVKGILTVNPLPVNSIVSSKGTSISKGETTVLTVNSNNGTTYSWSSASGIISGQNSAVLTVRPMQTTTYTVTVKNATGCESTSTITIEVKEDFVVQAENFITPNGDGVNDNWVIKNIDAYPNHTLSIFDRSGKELYKVRNYKNDWDGTFNGMPLAEGTYYYIIRFDQNPRVVKGFITIVRSK